MKKNIIELDSSGRIKVDLNLLELCGLADEYKVAICEMGDKLVIRKNNQTRGMKILGIGRISGSEAIYIPEDIRGDAVRFQVYSMNGNLILEEAH